MENNMQSGRGGHAERGSIPKLYWGTAAYRQQALAL